MKTYAPLLMLTSLLTTHTAMAAMCGVQTHKDPVLGIFNVNDHNNISKIDGNSPLMSVINTKNHYYVVIGNKTYTVNRDKATGKFTNTISYKTQSQQSVNSFSGTKKGGEFAITSSHGQTQLTIRLNVDNQNQDSIEQTYNCGGDTVGIPKSTDKTT
jgi:hypothetical protein